MLYKTSYYNFQFKTSDNSKLLVYNSLLNSLYEFNNEHGKKLQELSIKDIFSYEELIEKFGNEYTEFLLNEKIVITHDFDEAEALQKRLENQKESIRNSGKLLFVLLPTVRCNMRCPYCFEGDEKKGKMSIALITKIEEFAKQCVKINNGFFKEIEVTWFGGEPLLAKKEISIITSKIQHIAKKNQLKYSSNIITNGVLLNDSGWKFLKKNQISHIQVTIDGSRHLHNKLRPLRNGKDSYSEILENLSRRPEDIKVNIRINLDSDVHQSVNELLSDLQKAGIWPQNAKDIKIDYGHKCFGDGFEKLSNEEYFNYVQMFREIKLQHYNKWAENNNNKLARFKFQFPSFTSYLCGTVGIKHAFVIDPQGNIYKCWENCNNTGKLVCHIDDGYENILKKCSQYQMSNGAFFSKDNDCIKCNFLPICDMGICAERQNNESLEKPCTGWKSHLEKVITRQYDCMILTPEIIQSIK